MRIRKPRVLVVERDSESVRALVAVLGGNGYRVLRAHDDEAAHNALDAERVEAMIAPLSAPRIDGAGLLRRARARYPEVCVVLLAEGGEVERGVAAMRDGAADVEFGAASPDKLVALIERGLERQVMAARLSEARARLDDRFGIERFAAHSPAMRRVLEQVARVATSRVPVLIEGPTGSGKRTIAQAIHQRGPRRDAPFAWVACDAIASDEAEVELFGRAPGADLAGARTGRFERADGGTLYLGEVAALPRAAQAALLRALHDGGFVPVGGREPLRADVRLIAATRLDLSREAAAGRFRPDLHERLGVVIIRVPPLRERREDLPLLVETLLSEIDRERGRRATRITRGALERLALYDWPGNVRELRQTLEAMMVLAEGRRTLTLSDLPPELFNPRTAVRLEVAPGMTVSEVERRLIEATLSHAGADKRRAAALLGIGLRTLYRKLREYGLPGDPPRRAKRPTATRRAGRKVAAR